jgi:hypothetical protein
MAPNEIANSLVRTFLSTQIYVLHSRMIKEALHSFISWWYSLPQEPQISFRNFRDLSLQRVFLLKPTSALVVVK